MKNKKTIIVTVLTIFLPLLTLGIVLQAVKKAQTLKSSAQTISSLTPPYIRLDSFQKTYKVGEEAPVQILVNTGNMKTVENRFLINYDNTNLSINPKNIENKEIYPVLDVESIENGKLIFAIFVKDEAGYMPVSNTNEQLVTVLHFQVIDNNKEEVPINLFFDKTNEGTSMVEYPLNPTQSPANILKSIGGTIIQIK